MCIVFVSMYVSHAFPLDFLLSLFCPSQLCLLFKKYLILLLFSFFFFSCPFVFETKRDVDLGEGKGGETWRE